LYLEDSQKIKIMKTRNISFGIALVALSLFITTGCNKSEVQSITPTTNTVPAPPIKNTRGFPIVDVTITYGVDVEVDGIMFPCIGNGGPVCDVSISIGDHDCHPQQYHGSITTNENDEVIMHLDKTCMDSECLSYFDNGTTNQPQDKTISASVMAQIGFSSEFLIEAGDYSYTEVGDEYIINFGS